MLLLLAGDMGSLLPLWMSVPFLPLWEGKWCTLKYWFVRSNHHLAFENLWIIGSQDNSGWKANQSIPMCVCVYVHIYVCVLGGGVLPVLLKNHSSNSGIFLFHWLLPGNCGWKYFIICVPKAQIYLGRF